MSSRELTEKDVYAIMQSDIKLWEQATTQTVGTTVTKSMILPFGIGEMTVSFEGVDNGIKRRAAAEQWGAMVRERIKDRIDDDAITARAKQQAAIRESERESQAVGHVDSGDGPEDASPVGLRGDEAVQAPTATEPVQAYALSAEADQGPEGTDFAARAEWLRGRIGEGEKQIRGWRRELRALEAALEVLKEDE